MKSILCTVFAFVSFTVAHASELEVRILHLSGEQALPADLIRLSESGVLPSSDSFTTSIGGDGAFSYSTAKPTTHATSFDSAGKPDSTETSSTGLAFSGSVTAAADIYSLAFTFTTNDLQSVRIDLTASGGVFPRPIINTRSIKSSVKLHADSWTVMPCGTLKGDPQTVFLFRIRK